MPISRQSRKNSIVSNDDFSKKYGLISARANNSAFNSDSSYCLLASLEVLDDEATSSARQICSPNEPSSRR